MRLKLLDFLFPKTCVNCGAFGAYFCMRCREKSLQTAIRQTICPVCTKPAVGGATHPRCITRYTPDGLVSIFRYDGAVRKAIKLLKYRRVADVVDELVGLVSSVVNANPILYIPFRRFIELDSPTVTVVPLHSRREKRRWFNQSELIGQAFASQWRLRFSPHILVRTQFSKPQAGLAKKERLENIKGSFVLSPASSFTTNFFILIDDVWTTGATLRECVNVLKRGGVRRVWCVTVAR